MRGQIGWYPTVSTNSKTLSKINGQMHRYIRYVGRGDGGGLVIRGVIGERLYLDYSIKDAMKRYNEEARAAA